MENTPEAAAPATEATNTNTNPAPAEAPKEAPAANDLGLTAEQAAEFKKFVDANGGYDKAFETFKKRISEPAPAEPAKVEEPKAAAPVQAPAEAPKMPTKIPDGFISTREAATRRYFRDLADEPAYAAIADKIRSGDIIDDIKSFGIRVTDGEGNINEGQIIKYLDLYAKTIPTAPAKTPEASQAPTVNYIDVKDGKIENAQQAMQIISQSAELKARGLAEHPNNDAALEFLKNAWKK